MKKITREIIVVIFITILWGNSSTTNTENPSTAFVMIMMFLGYCFYVLMKKMPKCGYTESMLLFVNGFMVTALSFMSFPVNLGFIAIIIFCSYFVVKYSFDEKRSDFWEIVMLCSEAVRRRIVGGVNSTLV